MKLGIMQPPVSSSYRFNILLGTVLKQSQYINSKGICILRSGLPSFWTLQTVQRSESTQSVGNCICVRPRSKCLFITSTYVSIDFCFGRSYKTPVLQHFTGHVCVL
jgi:hypothetical protein